MAKKRKTEEEELDLEAELGIDEYNLDRECLEQPTKFARFAKLAAWADRKAKRKDEKVKTVRSELIKEATENPEREIGKKSPNAQDIEAYYRRQERYKDAKQELINAQHEASLYAYIVSAFHQRRSMLENMVKLHGQNYYAAPRADITQEFERQQREDRTNKEISKGMKRKK